jgi:outer membrane protein OmpA-like peptidoglycan-associated protein
MLRKFFITTSVAVLAVGGTSACASKNFVRTSVGEVNEKVDSLAGSLEETQERTRRNEGRIAEVDGVAQGAAQSARQAGAAAEEAQDMAREVAGRTDAIEKASRRLVYEVVINENQGNFRFNQTALPDEAKSAIDGLIQQLQSDPKNVFIEIEGHTDSTGDPLVNERIGLERAEAVQRYLYDQYQIPLHKMNIISYGEDKPVAPNNTREGRAQNRRVVIKVLA